MQVDAAEARRVEDRPRQEQAVGADDREIGAERGELGLRLGILERARRAHRQAQPLGRLVHGRAAQLVAAAGRAWRLGVDGGDLVAGGEQARRGWAGRSRSCP